MSPTAFAIVRFIGWSFLPSALANVLINGYHRIVHPGYPPPRPGTPAYVSQYRFSFTILAILYLLYTLVAAATSLPENYYEILGVDRAVDEQGLKIAFRAFARKNHPDRPSIGVGGEGRFREARNAFEVLKNPVKRFAYDRFGPDVMSWKDLSTPREYIRRGLSSASGFYVGSGALLLLMSILGKSGSLSFWRYVLFSTVLFTEAYLTFSPSPIIVNGEDVGVSDISHSLPILSALLPSRLPYQYILFLHQMFISLSVCISHLSPVLLPETVMSERDIMKTTFDLSHRISLVSGIAEREVSRMLYTELRALHGTDSLKTNAELRNTEALIDSLTENMQKLLIESRLRTHPTIRPMWDRVVKNAKGPSTPLLITNRLETSDSTIVPIDDAPPVMPSAGSTIHPRRGPSEPSRLSPVMYRALSPLSETDNGTLSDSGTVTSTHSTQVDRMSPSPPPPGRKALASRSPSPSPPRSPTFRRINTAGAASGAVRSPGVNLFQSNLAFGSGADSIE